MIYNDIFWEDVYTRILADIAILTVPFISVGMLGNVVILSISWAVAVVLYTALITHICYDIQTKR